LKFVLKNIGFSLIGLAIILSFFDFLLENKEIIFGFGFLLLIISYFIKR